jgi:hypothetical protein
MTAASAAHVSLITRLGVIKEAVSHELLVDKTLTDRKHNQRAQMLRNGLMIAAFTSVEDFLRVRTAELLACVSRTVLRFDLLPNELQRAATAEAMRAAYEQSKLLRKRGDDPLPMLQQTATEVASTSGSTLVLSKYGLGYSGMNLAADDVAAILRSLQVADVWGEIDAIAGRCGATSVSLGAAYLNGHRRRNSAAHDPVANIPPTDVDAFCNEAFSIALGFDILGSRAAKMLRMGDSQIMSGRARLSRLIEIRFLQERSSGFAERREGARRATRVTTGLEEAWKLAVASSTPSGDPIVLCDKVGRPVDWLATDVI